MRIREEVGKYIQRLQALAQGIATVDAYKRPAVVAKNQHLIRPEFGQDSSIDIQKVVMPSLKRSWSPKTYKLLIVSRWMKTPASS